MVNFVQVKNAVEAVADGMKRVDGKGFTVYQCGTIIRVDIKDCEKEG